MPDRPSCGDWRACRRRTSFQWSYGPQYRRDCAVPQVMGPDCDGRNAAQVEELEVFELPGLVVGLLLLQLDGHSPAPSLVQQEQVWEGLRRGHIDGVSSLVVGRDALADVLDCPALALSPANDPILERLLAHSLVIALVGGFRAVFDPTVGAIRLGGSRKHFASALRVVFEHLHRPPKAKFCSIVLRIVIHRRHPSHPPWSSGGD